jgi:molybdenum cofactor cytidylyltransferase
MIPGVVLASGLSARMGRAKALLTLPGTTVTFVEAVVRTLLDGGAADALVVGRPDDQALRAEVDRLGGRARFVENPRADTGQLSSVLAGLNAADRPGTRAVLVIPVDLPLVAPATVRALLDAFATSPAPIVRATHHGVHGHPVVFGREVFEALRHASPALGARSVVHAHPVLEVEVPDPGVLRDVDTPEDYDGLQPPRASG